MAVTITDVETAISAIQSGSQAVTVDGFSYTKANLDALLKLRKQIQEETARSDGSRPVFRGVNLSGMGYD